MEEKYADMRDGTSTNDLYGTIVSCNKLRVRMRPSKESDIIAIMDRNAEVLIEESESTEEFYKICTASGIIGYCMKQFIHIEEKNYGQHTDID